VSSSLPEQVEAALDVHAPVQPLGRRLAARARAFYELGKPNLSGMVVVTGVLGFYVGSDRIDGWRLLHLVVGLFLTSSGACAANMFLERRIDGAMRRTRGRPIPSGRVGASEAALFAAASFALGFAQLALGTNWLTAGLAALTLVVYAAIYTPLKRRGPIATWVGAIPGAIPPMMGWAAARGSIDAPAWVLFGILFFWQLPHFLALAWLYREDYDRAGYHLLPGRDGSIHVAGVVMTACCALLIAVSLLLVPFGGAGALYALAALGSGIVFFGFALRVALRPAQRHARQLFFASIAYLPAMLAIIVIDRALLTQ